LKVVAVICSVRAELSTRNLQSSHRDTNPSKEAVGRLLIIEAVLPEGPTTANSWIADACCNGWHWADSLGIFHSPGPSRLLAQKCCSYGAPSKILSKRG